MRTNSIALNHSGIEAELDRFLAEVSRPGNLSREIREVLEHIHANLFDPDLNVQSIKRRCRIRDNNISCRFRHVLGITLKEYIETLRLNAALRLLEKRFPVFDVAMAVGYLYPQTFYRAFHRKFDRTPTSAA
ncbi:MAG TPA: helix-turn-helix domain-containing protein [Thermoanaerobaculia bacterium]|nr:helix-turn-helix domain-containing protein [Thermoanaerobaculia bacterium]